MSLALTLALIIDPGLGVGEVEAQPFTAKEAPGVKHTLVNIFPDNPIQAMADGRMLQVIVFAILLGLALNLAGEAGKRVLKVFEDLNEIFMKLITMIIAVTPYGVFCLMVTLGARVGVSEITKLGVYFFTVAFVLALHMCLVYPTFMKVLAGLNPLTYLRKMREPMLVAFSTSSSGATLPVTLRTVEQRVGVSNKVASFAVPLGATIIWMAPPSCRVWLLSLLPSFLALA